MRVSCEPPSPNLYFFDGSIEIEEGLSNQLTQANLSLTQFIPRGALVQNCQMVAAVVYTGKDSKIILNQGHYSYKYSSMEETMNKIISLQIV